MVRGLQLQPTCTDCNGPPCCWVDEPFALAGWTVVSGDWSEENGGLRSLDTLNELRSTRLHPSVAEHAANPARVKSSGMMVTITGRIDSGATSVNILLAIDGSDFLYAQLRQGVGRQLIVGHTTYVSPFFDLPIPIISSAFPGVDFELHLCLSGDLRRIFARAIVKESLIDTSSVSGDHYIPTDLPALSDSGEWGVRTSRASPFADVTLFTVKACRTDVTETGGQKCARCGRAAPCDGCIPGTAPEQLLVRVDPGHLFQYHGQEFGEFAWGPCVRQDNLRDGCLDAEGVFLLDLPPGPSVDIFGNPGMCGWSYLHDPNCAAQMLALLTDPPPPADYPTCEKHVYCCLWMITANVLRISETKIIVWIVISFSKNFLSFQKVYDLANPDDDIDCTWDEWTPIPFCCNGSNFEIDQDTINCHLTYCTWDEVDRITCPTSLADDCYVSEFKHYLTGDPLGFTPAPIYIKRAS